MGHAGNPYARMEYLDSLRRRQETVDAPGARIAQTGSHMIAMTRGEQRSCGGGDTFVPEEDDEESLPTLCLSLDLEMAPPRAPQENALPPIGVDVPETPGKVPTPSTRQDAFRTIAVDVPETPGKVPTPPTRQDAFRTIAVDVPETPGKVPTPPTRQDAFRTIAVDVPETPGKVPTPSTRQDAFRTIAVEIPEAGLPPMRPGRYPAGPVDPRQTVAVDIPEVCPEEEDLPSDRVRLAAVRQAHANGRLMEKMRAALFR